MSGAVLAVDPAMIGQFVAANFARVPKGGYVSLRAFRERTTNGIGNSEVPPSISPVMFDDLPGLTKAAVQVAQEVASDPIPRVFCPPVAIFRTAKNAEEANIAQAPVLSVEIDKNPEASRRRLVEILGEPTCAVQSGGLWIDPRTGASEAKLHMHWRLLVPASSGEELKQLRSARDIATEIVGGDSTATPISHCLRWAGSWHRKDEPKLCRFASLSMETEVDLAQVLEVLRAVSGGAASGFTWEAGARPPPGGPEADAGDFNPFGRRIDGRETYARNLIWARLIEERRKGGPFPLTEGVLEEILADCWQVYERKCKARGESLEADGRGIDLLRRKLKRAAKKWDTEIAAEAAKPKPGGTWEETPEEEEKPQAGPQASAPPPDRSDFLVAAWCKLDLPPRDYLLENLMCSTSRWQIIGETGVGKTLFCLDLAFAIAAGANFLTWKGVRPCRVMYLDGEMPAETLKERIQNAAKLFGEPQLYGYNRDRLTDIDLPPLNKPEGQNWLLAEIDAVKPDLVVFDNIMSLLIGKMADEESWTPVVPFTRQLSARRIAQVWVHHTGHDTSHGFGSKTREWMMDTVAMLTKNGGEEETSIRLEFSKARLRTPATAALFKPLVIKRDDDGWTAEPTTSKRRENVAEQKQRWFAEAYDFLAIDIEATRGFTSKPVRKVAIDRIRALMQEREQLTAENGKLPDRERTAFGRAKEHFIAAKIMTAKDGFIWKI